MTLRREGREGLLEEGESPSSQRRGSDRGGVDRSTGSSQVGSPGPFLSPERDTWPKAPNDKQRRGRRRTSTIGVMCRKTISRPTAGRGRRPDVSLMTRRSTKRRSNGREDASDRVRSNRWPIIVPSKRAPAHGVHRQGQSASGALSAEAHGKLAKTYRWDAGDHLLDGLIAKNCRRARAEARACSNRRSLYVAREGLCKDLDRR